MEVKRGRKRGTKKLRNRVWNESRERERENRDKNNGNRKDERNVKRYITFITYRYTCVPNSQLITTSFTFFYVKRQN